MNKLGVVCVCFAVIVGSSTAWAEPEPAPAWIDPARTDLPAADGGSEDRPLLGDPWGGGAGEGLKFGVLTFRFMLQTRLARTFAPDSENPSVSARVIEETLARENDGIQLRRMFVRLGAEPFEYLELKAVADLAAFVRDDVNSVVKQAYATLKPVPKHVEISAGMFKLPFSLLELDPLTNYYVADPGATDRLLKRLDFAGRDIGAEVLIAPLKKSKRLRLVLGVFRGHAHDESDAIVGSLAGRIESQPIKGLRFGVDWVEQPKQAVYRNTLETSDKDLLPDPVDPQYPRAQTWARGRAVSADARYQRHHMTVAVEGMVGDRVDFDRRYGASTFAAVWALASYKFPVGPLHLMPVLRAEWLDADWDNPVGLRRTLTLALNVHFTNALRFTVDVTQVDVQSESPRLNQPKPLPEAPYYELDTTRVVGQLQVAL